MSGKETNICAIYIQLFDLTVYNIHLNLKFKKLGYNLMQYLHFLILIKFNFCLITKALKMPGAY